MLDLLVEIKNEYTIQLINILSPLIFQGIQSIYKDAYVICKDKGELNKILKVFQSCLKSIINWNQVTIDNETTRIVSSPYISGKTFSLEYNHDWLSDLVKAVLKSHMEVLTFNPNKQDTDIDLLFYKNVKLSYFIHRVYIECAIELWNNPYLLYHDYQPIELKRNHRDCIYIIKECIKQAIRKILPLKQILVSYLNTDLKCMNNKNMYNTKTISIVTKLNNDDVLNNVQKDIEDCIENDDDNDDNDDNDNMINKQNIDDNDDDDNEDDDNDDNDDNDDDDNDDDDDNNLSANNQKYSIEEIDEQKQHSNNPIIVSSNSDFDKIIGNNLISSDMTKNIIHKSYDNIEQVDIINKPSDINNSTAILSISHTKQPKKIMNNSKHNTTNMQLTNVAYKTSNKHNNDVNNYSNDNSINIPISNLSIHSTNNSPLTKIQKILDKSSTKETKEVSLSEKIKNVLKNDLRASEFEETSINYQDIFSNSDI